MASMTVIYRTPKDIAAFDKHYFETHIPLAKKLPGLRKYEVSQGPILTPAGPADFHRVGTLEFDDLAAIHMRSLVRKAESRPRTAFCSHRMTPSC